MHMLLLLLLLLGSDVFTLADPLAQKATILGVQQQVIRVKKTRGAAAPALELLGRLL